MFTKVIDSINEELDAKLCEAERARFERLKADGALMPAVLVSGRKNALLIKEALLAGGITRSVCVVVSDLVEDDKVYMVADKGIAKSILLGYTGGDYCGK